MKDLTNRQRGMKVQKDKRYVSSKEILEELYKMKDIYCLNSIVVGKSMEGNLASAGNAESYLNMFSFGQLENGVGTHVKQRDDKDAEIIGHLPMNDIIVIIDQRNCAK